MPHRRAAPAADLARAPAPPPPAGAGARRPPAAVLDGRAERGERSARALARAAKRVFARDGFRAASVRAIAAAARVHPALIRYHFGSKQGLYARVIDDAMGGLRERLTAALAGARSLEGALAGIVDGYLDHLERDRDFPRLVLRGLLDRDPRILRVAETHLGPGLAALTAAIGGGRARGDRHGDGGEHASASAALRDGAVSLFGAAIAPFVYAPLIAAATGEDPLATAPLARRRAHLHALAAAALAGARAARAGAHP